MKTSKTFAFILILTLVTSSMTSSSCGHEWFTFRKFCYRWFGSTMTWETARSMCQHHHGDLASIHTLEENEIVNLVARTKAVWIGLRFNEKTEQYEWSDGSGGVEEGKYSNWRATENDDSTVHIATEDCGQINFNGLDEGEWDDRNCFVKLGFVCKRVAPEYWMKLYTGGDLRDTDGRWRLTLTLWLRSPSYRSWSRF